ncbi:MAG: ABC transporter ATP-binding protein [Desulfobacteraceae bacterium]|jgi:branched-chain amino acid transport system ATP-binding protein|nr:ABC transporter ATP-binding protein [Desulfobacteraceae bacterium]
MAILETKGLKKSFGGLMAVAGVDMETQDGQIHSIIGPNGAGKTTLFNLISGYYPCDEGQVFFKGRDITDLSPQKIVKMGMGRSFQVTNIFPKLSVFENIQATILYRGGKGLSFFSEVRRLALEETKEILSMVELIEQAQEMAGILSAGDRKRLELGIVLATKPDLLLLDEPTCGMSPGETANTIELIKKIAQEKSLTVLFTEHKMDVVFSISSHITVMNFGAIIAAGKPDDIRTNEKVQKIYFGEK